MKDAAQERYFGSPLKRPGAVGRARNAAVALGNRPTDRGRDALVQALEAESAITRSAAFWALSRGHLRDHGMRDRLSGVLSRENDADAALDMGTSLERAGA